MKLQFKLLILSLFISFIGYSQTISVSGTIATNTTWSADTVKVTGDIFVSNLITLTVNPHTYVEFQGYYTIQVNGRMLAIGNASDSISFAIKDTTGFFASGTSGGWNSIALDAISPLNDTSRLEYCKITNSKQWSIYAHNCKIRVEHCLFYNNTTALLIYTSGRPIVRYNNFRNNNEAVNVSNGSSPLISHNFFVNNNQAIAANISTLDISYNTISNNVQGIVVSALLVGSVIHDNNISYNSNGIWLANDTNTIVFNNIINHNYDIYSGAGVIISNSSSTIINNTIAYNTALGGAGIIIGSHSSPLIIFNKIANNYVSGTGCASTDNGAGILCALSSPLIMNNLICNNEAESNGGGIGCLDSSSITIINNTISNNKANNVIGGGGLSFWGYSKATLKNNIIWGDEAPSGSNQIFSNSSVMPLNIAYCDISDTINSFGYVGINYQHLMMSDPIFVSPSAGAGITFDGLAADWSLRPTSPCIDAGTPDTTGLHLNPSDIFGDPRILNGTVDMGAYEFTPTMSISDINNFINNNLLVYPNPANEDINIIVKNTNASNLSLKITNVLGQVVYEENVESTTTFFYKTVNVAGFSKGMYSLSLTDNKGVSYSKLIIKE